jgi:peptide/nickel transport system substrate-binding protein
MRSVCRNLSRRRCFELAGLVGTGVIAGCGTDRSVDDGSSGDTEIVYRMATSNSNPADLQWNNYYAQQQNSHPMVPLMFDYLIQRGSYPRSVDGSDLPTELPQIADSYAVDGRRLTVSLSDEYTWHNGDPVVADDVLTQFKIEQHLGGRTGRVWEEIEAPDESTVEFVLSGTNPNIFVPQLLPNELRTKHDTKYGDFLERFESATTEEALQSAREAVVQETISNPVGNGPWQFETSSDSLVTLVPHDGHPAADATDIDRIEIEALPNNSKRWQSFGQGMLDALTGTPPASIEDQFPDSTLRLAYVSGAGDCFKFNHDGLFSDPRIRKAIAFAIDRDRNANNAKDFVDVIEYPDGLSNRVTEQYFDDEPPLSKYGYTSANPERATELLEAAGYTRADGEWIDADGERLRIDIISGSGGTWKFNNQSAARTLQEFGIDAVPNVLEAATYGERLNNGEFDIAISAWGVFGGGRHPYNFFSQEYSETRNRQQGIDPTAVEVPYPIGDRDGDTETVDVMEKIEAIAAADSEALERERVQEMAWIYNQHLPRLPLMNGVGRTFLATDDWDLPPTDSKWMMEQPYTELHTHGQLQSRD